jgi:hypothetical protein
MARSHIPLSKWALAFRLMAESKKGVPAHRLHRMPGLTYKAAWFMAHRAREAMGLPKGGPMDGSRTSLEADQSDIGRKSSRATRVAASIIRCQSLRLQCAGAPFARFTSIRSTRKL